MSKIIKNKIISLLERCKNYLWISTGFDLEFYNDGKIKNAMVETFMRVEEVRIIIDGDVETKKNELTWLFEVANEHKEKIQIRQAEGILHWFIVDGKHFRLEKWHPSGVVWTDNLFIYDSDLIISEKLKRDYENFWYNAETFGL